MSRDQISQSDAIAATELGLKEQQLKGREAEHSDNLKPLFPSKSNFKLAVQDLYDGLQLTEDRVKIYAG